MPVSLLRLCRVDEIADDALLRVAAAGTVYAVAKSGGEVFVLADQCTHGPGNLSEGAVLGTEVECPFHQGRFDLRTGQPTYPPCTEAVRTWTATVKAGEIFIDQDEPAKAG
ncbi:MAG: non-heme iron oxygenase ferredoxin subunit [Alphaproteobacteria bacterium]|nr:non-heme iron oxygenase ferredoxin subunit [Alphaproteobacteria bacterium]